MLRTAFQICLPVLLDSISSLPQAHDYAYCLIPQAHPKNLDQSTSLVISEFPMKTFVVIVTTFAVALALGWFLGGRQSHVTPVPATFPPVAHAPVTSTIPPVPSPASSPPSNLPLPSEWQELRAVRNITFQNNPALAAEYKSLLAEMDDQQKRLDEAMIKVDPKVAPIVAKLEQLRKKNSVTHSPAVSN